MASASASAPAGTDDQWLIQECIRFGQRKIVAGSRTGITDQGLQRLDRAVQLQILSLADCSQITGAGLSKLSNCIGLQELDLNNCPQIGNEELRQLLPNLPLLRVLRLSNTQVDQSLLPALAKLASLQRLEMSHCPEFNSEVMQRLSACLKPLPTGRAELFRRNRDVTLQAGLSRIEALRALTVANPYVETLTIPGNSPLTRDEASVLLQFSRLRSLCFSQASVSGDAVGFLPSTLKEIRFEDSAIKNAVVSQLPAGLERLSLVRCPNITPSLANQIPRMLTSLSIRQCHTGGTWHFTLPNLRQLDISHRVGQVPASLVELSCPVGEALPAAPELERLTLTGAEGTRWNVFDFRGYSQLRHIRLSEGRIGNALQLPSSVTALELEGVKFECLRVPDDVQLSSLALIHCRHLGEVGDETWTGRDATVGIQELVLDSVKGLPDNPFPDGLLKLTLIKFPIASLAHLPVSLRDLTLEVLAHIARLDLNNYAALERLAVGKTQIDSAQLPNQLQRLSVGPGAEMPLPNRLPTRLATLEVHRRLSLEELNRLPPSLTELLLHGPQAYADIVRLSPNLRSFRMGDVQVGDDFLARIPEGVRKLWLSKSGRFTTNGVAQLSPRLEYLHLAQLPIKPAIAEQFPTTHIEGLTGLSKNEELATRLSSRVLGQDHAVREVVPALSRFRIGVAGSGKPVSVLFFTGPTGVGKTELAQAIADELDGPLVRLDMSEYSGEHSWTNLTGGSKNFVGSTDGGAATKPVHENPRSVVLFDEIEKAHPKVIKGLLGLLDAARMNDPEYGEVDFSQTIIIFTSNLGAAQMAEMDWDDPATYSDAREMAKQLLSIAVAPEFVGRLRRIIPFRAMRRDALDQVLSTRVLEAGQRLAGQLGIRLSIDPAVWLRLPDSIDLRLGARPAVNAVTEELETLLGTLADEAMISRGDNVLIHRRGTVLGYRIL